jgi:hypothetical protein
LAAPAGTVTVAGVVGPESPGGVPAAVLAAFGLASAVPVRLPGGQGTTWRAVPAVLKPVDSLQAGRWIAEVYATLNGPPGCRSPSWR